MKKIAITLLSTLFLASFCFAADPKQTPSPVTEEKPMPSVRIPTDAVEITTVSPSGVVTVAPEETENTQNSTPTTDSSSLNKKDQSTVSTVSNESNPKTLPKEAVVVTTVTSTPKNVIKNEEEEKEALYISQHLEIIPAIQHEEDKKMHYAIDVEFPQIKGAPLTMQAKQFNHLINSMVQESVHQFKNYVKADATHMKTLPVSLRHNTMRIDYDVDLVKPEKHTFISVRLSIEGMQAGRALPYHTYKVLNFDLQQGKELTLNDIFKPGAKYLTLFAKYSHHTLLKTLHDKWMISRGTTPTAKNYQFWNIQSDGILITFNEYQVAPYAKGAQEVAIPFHVLKPLMSSRTPIAACAKNSTRCEA